MKSIARTSACSFALGVGLAIAAGGGAAVADASPIDSGSTSSASPAASSGNTGAGAQSSSAQARRGQPSSTAGPSRLSPQSGRVSAQSTKAVSDEVSAATSVVRIARSSGPAVVRAAGVIAPPVTPNVPVSPTAPVTQTVVGAVTSAARDVEQGRMYGNPALNSKYWVAQSSSNCVLMATAMVIGQLTGKTPTEAQIVFEASTTPSVDPDRAGRNMYLGLKSNEGVDRQDAMKLLANHGINSTLTTYPGDPDAALEVVKAALDRPDQAVMVSIDADYIWSRLDPRQRPTADVANTTNHMVALVGVDTSTNTVYLNDSGWDTVNPATGRPWGQNEAVPLDVFIKAWSAGDYRTIVATADGDPKPQTAWVNIAPRRDTLHYTVNTPSSLSDLRTEDPDAAAHWVHYRNNA
ncbi:C39 family peptidase [Mycolicibacterium komossense]|uniref:C39 family peptidase n=1 Tax=Mycolicibacterium komossense TaxID=1779 RepID=A0ABT3CM98_9MYCO|nr:C39 family peptidase [Mycolicibacterium komossense]MCV7230560.1 C39 family peptidase [Mycolicibacterium komossense]